MFMQSQEHQYSITKAFPNIYNMRQSI